MIFYLDTSAIVPLFLQDPHEEAMRIWLREEPRHVVLSDFAAAEFVGVVARFFRTRELTESMALKALSRFDNWRAHSVMPRVTSLGDVGACERLVRDFKLKLNVPDALHLALVMTDGLPLVTFDQRLASAARAVRHPVVQVPASI
jgi:predicted nucleic acid-binding protein